MIKYLARMTSSNREDAVMKYGRPEVTDAEYLLRGAYLDKCPSQAQE